MHTPEGAPWNSCLSPFVAFVGVNESGDVALFPFGRGYASDASQEWQLPRAIRELNAIPRLGV